MDICEPIFTERRSRQSETGVVDEEDFVVEMQEETREEYSGRSMAAEEEGGGGGLGFGKKKVRRWKGFERTLVD